ncbi:MAG: hypothetical protein ABH811_01455 [archaeon]
MEKFIENIQSANKTIKIIDHMVYVTFPLIKDKRLLLKILLETKKAIVDCINSILQYEYLYKRIKLYKNQKENLRTFKEKCASKYNITKQEINLINELFEIAEQHKKSPFEFIKDKKIIILSEELQPKIITFEKTKEFLILGKNILNKTKQVILR